MNKYLSSVLLSSALVFVACKNPAADAPKAEVAEAAAPAAATAPAAADEALPISQDQSKVGFVGSKVTGSHDGGFNKFSGTIHLNPTNLEASRIEVDIDMDSVFSDDERLTGHLKTGDFFLIEQFPTAKFVSSSVKAGGENGATHTITGNLTKRGVTKAISFPATVTVDPTNVRAKADFALARSQFGITYAAARRTT